MSISYTQLLQNLKKDVFLVNNVFSPNEKYVLLNTKDIQFICDSTKHKVVLWDYVNMKATLEKIKD